MPARGSGWPLEQSDSRWVFLKRKDSSRRIAPLWMQVEHLGSVMLVCLLPRLSIMQKAGSGQPRPLWNTDINSWPHRGLTKDQGTWDGGMQSPTSFLEKSINYSFAWLEGARLCSALFRMVSCKLNNWTRVSGPGMQALTQFLEPWQAGNTAPGICPRK